MQQKAFGHDKKYLLKIIALLLLVVCAAFGMVGTSFFYKKYQAAQAHLDSGTKKETNALIGEVGLLMELPVGETPTVATIADKDKLRQQPFFHTTENGDILLVYPIAAKAILYRPTSHKIINVAGLALGATSTVEEGEGR